MDRSLNITNGTLETSIQRLKEKYLKKTKETLKIPSKIRHDTNSFQCRLCSSKITVYKKKINDLLVNNNDLARSLEASHQDKAQLEQQLNDLQRQLLYKSAVESKLVEVSTQLNVAASVITNIVASIIDVKKLLSFSGTNLSVDTMLSEDNSWKLNEIHSSVINSTVEKPPLQSDKFGKRKQQPVLDISTIMEVSSILTEEAKNLPLSTKPADTTSTTPPNDALGEDIRKDLAKVAETNNQCHFTPENKELNADMETPKTPILSSNYFLHNKSHELFNYKDLETENTESNLNHIHQSPDLIQPSPLIINLDVPSPPKKAKTSTKIIFNDISSKPNKKSTSPPLAEAEKENIDELSDFCLVSKRKTAKKSKRGRPPKKSSSQKKEKDRLEKIIQSEVLVHRSPITPIENLLPSKNNSLNSNSIKSPLVTKVVNSPLKPLELLLSPFSEKLSIDTASKTPKNGRGRKASQFKNSFSTDRSSSSSTNSLVQDGSRSCRRRKVVSYREPSTRTKLRQP